jgi:hypothetical protein
MNRSASHTPLNDSNRRSSRFLVLVEALEPRSLLSGEWSTVDSAGNWVSGMVADRSGNVYVSGWGPDPVEGEDKPWGIRQKSSDSTEWTTIYADPNVDISGVATDAAGNVFACGMGWGPDGQMTWVTLERPAGRSEFSVIDSFVGGECLGIATNAAGDVYAVGPQFVRTTTTKGNRTTTTTTSYSIARKLAAGQSAFGTVYRTSMGNLNFWTERPGSHVTVIDGGPSAGVYLVGTSTNETPSWRVLKSADGGVNWSQVDAASGIPTAVAGDSAGNLYVAGTTRTSTIVGYDPKTRKPIYRQVAHWTVRKSGNGGASWSIDDDYQLSSVKDATAYALGTDAAGNVYAGGFAIDAAGQYHAVMRSQAGGAWSTVDDYAGPAETTYTAFAADAVTGTLYAGGSAYWESAFIRSAPGPIPSVIHPETFSTILLVDEGDSPDGGGLDLRSADVLA